jgi:hypothetical protein
MVGADGQSMIMQRQEKVNCPEGRQRSANSGEIWVWMMGGVSGETEREKKGPRPCFKL